MGTDYVTQNVTTTNQLPAWYTAYLAPLLQQATAQSQEPYQGYTGPMVAGLSGPQWYAMAQARDTQGMGMDAIRTAEYGSLANAGIDTGHAGATDYGQARDLFGRAAGIDTAAMATPLVNKGTGLLEEAAGGSSLAQANPYIQQSISPTGLQAASPFLGAAAQTFPGAAQQYMSPYTDAVVNRIAQLGGRNLSENLLPQISDQFVRAGQYGSPQQRDVIGRAVRDTQESVLGQQAQALESGYGQAGQLFGQDQARLAGLAGTAGGLGTQQQQILQGAGATLGNLSATDLSRLAAAGVNIGNLGLGQAGLAGADATRQLQAGQGLQGIGNTLVNASQVDAARALQGYGQMGTLAQTAQNITDQQIANQAWSGNLLQGQEQRNYDAAYGQFQEQQNYPWQQIQNASSVIQGMPAPVSGSTSSVTGQPGPSATSQIAGVGLGLAGLGQSRFFSKGGKAVKKRSNHSYGNMPRRGIAFMEAA